MDRIVSIHQPSFFPYMGFFEKVQQADLFVIMGRCQYEKGGYQNRFMFNHKWYTMPVAAGLVPINEKEYLSPKMYWNEIKKSLPEHRSKLETFDDCISFSLFETNLRIIMRACLKLNINTDIVLDYPTDLTGSERLLDICIKNNATKYLSGISGKKYLDVALFERNGIEVIFQDESTMDKRSLLEIL